MHWKKYGVLLPPFLFIGILLVIYLPVGQKHFSMIAVAVFWVVYYTWVYKDKKGKEKS